MFITRREVSAFTPKSKEVAIGYLTDGSLAIHPSLEEARAAMECEAHPRCGSNRDPFTEIRVYRIVRHTEPGFAVVEPEGSAVAVTDFFSEVIRCLNRNTFR